MIVVLLENPTNVISSVLNKFYAKYPKSCRGFISDKTPNERVVVYNHPPLLSSGWLLMCTGRVTRTLIKRIGKLPENNIIIFQVESQRDCQAVQQELSSVDLEFMLIDNYKIKKEEVISYICTSLKVSKLDADYLYKRHDGYVRDIMTSVKALSLLPYVTRVEIKKFTVASSRLRLYDISNYLLGLSESKVSYEKVIQLVYQYQYGFDYLLKSIADTLEEYLHVYKYLDDGALNITNYREFKAESVDSVIKGYSEYRLMKVIESYQLVSVEKVYFVLHAVKGFNNDSFGVVQLIDLLRLSKEVNRC